MDPIVQTLVSVLLAVIASNKENGWTVYIAEEM